VRKRPSVSTAILVAALLIMLLPLAWTALAAFNVQANDSTSPPSWTTPPSLDQFSEIGVAEPTFWQEVATSTGISAVAAVISVTVALLAGYGLARSPFRGRRPLVQGFLVLASLPAMAYVIPLSELMRRASLDDTLAGVALSEAAVTAPLAVFVLYGFLGQLSPEWEEAAVLDGAGLRRILWEIVVPLAAPAIGATAVILFVLDWNLLLVPLVLTAGHVKMIPVAMSDFFTFERELEWPTAAAALLVSLLPLALVVAVFHHLLERFTLEPLVRHEAPRVV
jgi:ABC-type glycerol-3-phosphate transport system permease component